MSVVSFIKKITGMRKSGGRYYYAGDSSKGLEYNKFLTNNRVSKCVYSVDVARTPHIVSSKSDNSYIRIDVLKQAQRVNKCNPVINFQKAKVNGRR